IGYTVESATRGAAPDRPAWRFAGFPPFERSFGFGCALAPFRRVFAFAPRAVSFPIPERSMRRRQSADPVHRSRPDAVPHPLPSKEDTMAPRRSALWTIAACFAMLLVSAATASAQSGKITGIVTDAATGQPLAGVQVSVEGTGRSVLTQENGRYFLINIPPGTHTVVAQILGYATMRRENVLVAIDVTRTVDFPMTSEALAVAEIIVEAERVPVIETSATGTQDIITVDEIQSLPISSINEALSLRAGYLDVPLNTEILSQAEEERGINPVRIRGGRGGETLTLIDGVPITNFVFGSATFQPNPFATQQIDFIRGGFEPQYGNALSGIINIALREGGTELEGSMEYRTSALAGALGSKPDELEGLHQFQGYGSGPVPGTGARLRFAISGREERSASRVREFDDIVFDPRFQQLELGAIQPNALDIV